MRVNEDPYQTLERLHEEWSDATDELEQIWSAWRSKWGNSELRDRYYATQDKAMKLVQQIMALKQKHKL